MSATTVDLNPATLAGGAKSLHDSLTTVDGVAAPVGAVVQMVKLLHGPANSGTSVSQETGFPVVPSNITTKFRESFEAYTPGTKWNEVKGSGDIIQVDGNAAAASYLVISKNPLAADTESSITSDLTFTLPAEIVFGLSMSQRTLGQEFAVEIVDTGTPLADVADIAISSITQTTTTLTVNTVAAHGLVVGKSIGIRGCVDARANYPALVVASVPALNQFTATAGPGGAIASQSLYIAPVVAATTAALPTSTYSNGTAGVGATLTATDNGAFPAQDGITLALNDRVLVKNEATAANNGLYLLTTVGTVSTPWVLTRAADFDTAGEMLISSYVSVLQGTTQATHRFVLAATVTTVGTTAATFTALGAGLANNFGFVYFRERLGRAQNGISQIFENATTTNASLYLRSEAGDALPSGTITGSHSITVGTTASVALVPTSPNMYTWSPTTEFRIAAQSDRVQWSDAPVDTLTQSVNRSLRTQVCPDPNSTYKLRIRAINNKSLTVPNARVVSVAKSGTTTGTFTTDVAHGYTTGDLVVYYGSNDTAAANFPNLTTATAITVTGADTFTAVIGTGTSGTAYGGYVAKVQGGNLMSALGAFSASTVVNATLSTLSDGTRQLVLTGTATWGAAIGDNLNVLGCRTSSASLGVDGAWKASNIATTALTLVPATAAMVPSLPADFGTTTCGGGVIRRTDLRLSFVRIFDYERQRVELLARPSGDLSAAAPVSVQGGTLTANQGTMVALPAGTATIGQVRLALPETTADVASAAITTTATVAAVTPASGHSYEVNIPVTAVTGTNPTMDVSIEESDDSGTNWFKVYDFPRTTAVGIYRSPKLPLTGNRVRYVQTIGGATPSFTRAINRLTSSDAVGPLRQLVDRSVTLTTLNSTTPTLNTQGTRNAQLVVNVGAITTTAPAIQLEGSDDNGASWYAIGAPLTAVASSTVQATVSNVQAQAMRGRVSTAGSGVTAGYVAIKGF